MNIFYLHADPAECAKQHTDKHVIKMIVEYAQLMSTAHRLLDGKQSVVLTDTGRKKKIWTLSDKREDVLYKATHMNHPSAVWVRNGSQNYDWLFKMWCCLLEEYTFRYGKTHATSRLKEHLMFIPNKIRALDFYEPPKAMPIEFQVSSSVDSYRAYYLGAKSHMFSWKSRGQPEWVVSQ